MTKFNKFIYLNYLSVEKKKKMSDKTFCQTNIYMNMYSCPLS